MHVENTFELDSVRYRCDQPLSESFGTQGDCQKALEHKVTKLMIHWGAETEINGRGVSSR
jgi:hypothetical protein